MLFFFFFLKIYSFLSPLEKAVSLEKSRKTNFSFAFCSLICTFATYFDYFCRYERFRTQ